MTADLAIVVVSTNEAHWLSACLSSVFQHRGSVSLDVVVADNESTDGTEELVQSEFPEARVVRCPNHGFGHANNRGVMTTDARYVLFLNPDTVVLEGTFEALVRAMDERPAVGVAGVRQVMPDGDVFPTIRRFPSVRRSLFEALGAERIPFGASRLGERELDMAVYDTEARCDWTSGSFMFTRREALDSAGLFDERFFIYSEETDLCYRIKQAGWEIVHLPVFTIVHHADKAGWKPKVYAQEAFARRQYMRKHYSLPRRAAGTAALALGYALRATLGGRNRELNHARRACARASLAALLGCARPPYGEPPARAVAPRRRR